MGSLSLSLSNSSPDAQPPAKRPRIMCGDVDLLKEEEGTLELLLQEEGAGLAVNFEERFGLDRPTVVKELVLMNAILLGEEDQVLTTAWSVLTRFLYRVQVETRVDAAASSYPHPCLSLLHLRLLIFLSISFAVDTVCSLEQEDQLGSLNEWALVFDHLQSGEDIGSARCVRLSDQVRHRQTVEYLGAKNRFAAVLDWRIRSPTCWEFLTLFTERLCHSASQPMDGFIVESVVHEAFELVLAASLALSQTHSPSFVAAVALTLAVSSVSLEHVPRPQTSLAAFPSLVPLGVADEAALELAAKTESAEILAVKADVDKLKCGLSLGLIERIYRNL